MDEKKDLELDILKDALRISSNDSNDNSNNNSESGSGGSNNTGGSGGGRSVKFTEMASTDSDAGADNQTDLALGSEEYEQYVKAYESAKVNHTVNDVLNKSVVYNKNKDDSDLDGGDSVDKISSISDKLDRSKAAEANDRVKAIKAKKIRRVTMDTIEQVPKVNFRRYRSKAALCNFDKKYDKATRDFGISPKEFIKKHDRDGNGRVNKNDRYLDKHDKNHDGVVDENDKGWGR